MGELAATRRTTRGAIGLTGVVDVAVDQLGQDRQTADAVGEHVVHHHRQATRATSWVGVDHRTPQWAVAR